MNINHEYINSECNNSKVDLYN